MYLENETTEESLVEEVGIQTEVLYGELEETGQGERLGAEVRYLVSPADTTLEVLVITGDAEDIMSAIDQELPDTFNMDETGDLVQRVEMQMEHMAHAGAPVDAETGLNHAVEVIAQVATDGERFTEMGVVRVDVYRHPGIGRYVATMARRTDINKIDIPLTPVES